MNKSFSQMKTNVGSEVQDTTSTFATIIGRFINRRYFQILRTINWDNINWDYTFNTVAGQQKYALPADFGKEMSVTDTTNQIPLIHEPLQNLYENLGTLSTQGNPQSYDIIEDVVQQQPSSASALSIVSSAAGDTSQTIFVRGISSGVEIYESVTLTGTSAATTLNAYTRIKGLSKSAVTTGTVTITANSGATTQAVIPPSCLETRYKIATLHYVPNGVATISMPYIEKPMPMSQDYDYPTIDIADLIELGAISDAYKYKRQFGKANAYELMFTQQLSDFIFDRENQPNQTTRFNVTPTSRDTI